MFGKKSNDNGEKLYRYSIRKYHFGAASVAIAALMFFANGVARADMAVSPATANTEKVGVAVTGLTEGVPPTEGHSEKSQEVGSEKEAIAKKSVDKSALNQALSELQAAIAKADEESLLSLSNQLSQLTDENKRLLDGENVSEEAIASQVSRVQSFTEQVRLLKSKAKDKDSNKEDRTDSKVQDKKELKVSDKAVIPTDQTEEIKDVQKDDNKEDTANKDKLESLSKSLITYLYTAKKIERPETKKFLEGVEEVVRSVENGLKNPQLTASEIEELMKKGKQAEKKLALAIAREHSGKRDLDNGKKMLPDSYFRAATYYRAADGKVYDSHGDDRLTEATVGYITKANDGSGYPPGTFLYISHNDNASANGRNNADLGPQPVKRLKQKVLAEVTKQSNGYHWKITYNNARESRQNPIYYFTVPSGHSVQNMTLKENGSVVKHGGVAQVFNGEADKYLTAVGSPNGGVNGSPYYENVANTQNGIVGNRGGIYTLDDFVRNDTSVYFNRDGMSEDDKRITDKLYDKIKSSTQNVFAFRPRDFDKGNTYVVEFDTVGDTEDPLYYIAGMKSYEKIPTGRFMHKSYQQWYGVQEQYNVTVNTNALKTTFLKGTGIGTLDTASGLMSNAVTIEDTYHDNRKTNPGRGDVTDYYTYKSTGNFSADYFKSFHNRFSRQRSEDGVNTTADRTKGNHTLYIEAKVKGQPIKFRLPYRIVTQSDIYQPVAKEVTDTKNYKADLGNADTYIKSYTDVSSQIDGFKTPDTDDMETPNLGNSFYKDRISYFPRTSDKIKEQAVKQVQWVGDSSLSTGKRVIELTLDNRKTELFTVPDDIDVLPGGKISAENVAKLNAAIREAYQKVDTNGNVSGTVPTVTSTTPVWVQKQIKVTYYDNENNSRTNNQDDSVDYVDVLFKHIQKEAKPAAPTIATPLDGSASVTPNGTTDKMVVSYRPTGQHSDTTLTVKKEGSSWGVVGNRPDGVTVDTSTGRVSITEPTVEDNTKIKAIATYLNSDETSAEDTVKSRDTQAPTVMMNGRPLTERASDNRFVIFRGADFNPIFKVADNSNTIAEFNVKNIPNGVWFNKSGNKDYARTLITNGDYHFSNTKVDDNAPLVTREASVTVRDLSGNAKEYKFEYTIADVMVRNSPKAASLNDKIGDSHSYLIDTLNGSTDQGNKFFPGGMNWEWENANQDTRLTNLGLVRHVAKAVFPTGAQNGSLTANGMTLYAPREIKKEVNFNVTDNAKPQATLNGVSLGTTAGEPIFTIFRGATFNPELKAWDNAGKISNVTVSGLPGGVTSTNFPGGQQTGSETQKYIAKLSNGTVDNSYALGEHEATLTVTGSDSKDVSIFKFKYRVVDLDFKNVYETPDAGQPGGKSYVIGLHDGNSVNVTDGAKNINPKDYWKVINDSSKADRGYSYLPDGVTYSINNGGISSNPADASKRASIAMGHYARMIKADFSRAGDIANNDSTSRTVFAPAFIERRILVAVDPTAPTIDGGTDLLYGQAGYKPDIKIKNIVNIGENASEVGTVNKEAIRTIQLYSDQDDTTPIAEHSFDKGSRETEWIFRESDISHARPNGLREGETLYARVKVTHLGVSTMSGNSNEKEVTARLSLIENATNRIVQANDSKLNDAEKAAIRIALKKANPTLGLQDENIEISDSGAIVVTKDKKRGWLQTEPNKNRGEGFVTRFADIRKDFLLENIEGAKLSNRDTDKGFAWSNSTSDPSVNGNRSLIYYYDATKGQGINLNDVLRMMHLKPKAGTNSVENPSLVEARGDDKEKAEHNREGYSKDSRTNEFKKGSDYINTLDLVDAGNLSGGQVVSNSPNKLVENGKGTPNAYGTNLQNATIEGTNGIPSKSLEHVVNGSRSIYKAQLYLRPEYVNTITLSKRGENKDTTTNVINVYFVPIDPVAPQVERSATNNLASKREQAGRLDANTSFKSLAKVLDNYDKDDVTNATTNTVRNKLNIWVKNGSTKKLIVENGVEKADVIASLKNEVNPMTYEVVAKTTDASGNKSHEEDDDGASLGFFKVGYDLVARETINVKQGERLTQDELNKLIQVQEGNERQDLPQGATVRATLDTATIANGGEETKTAEATVDFGQGRTKKLTIRYRVLRTFPVANLVYDFHGQPRGDNEASYYSNTRGLPSGMDWYLKKGNQNQPTSKIQDYLKNDPIGSTEYTFGAKYNAGQFTNSPTADDKLKHEGRLVHKVFDVMTNPTKVTVEQGASLSDTQAKNAVIKVANSENLPEGTTYEWVNASGGRETARATTSGEQTFHVKITLPKSQVTGSDLPGATQVQPSKIIAVTVNVTPPKPTFDTAPVTSTSRTITGTLGGLNASAGKAVVRVALNDGSGRVLTSENNGGVTISGNTWTATLPNDVKLRQSVQKNGENVKPANLTVTTTIAGTQLSRQGDDKVVQMGSYAITPAIAGSKHIDFTVPHDAKRVELRFHNSEESGNKTNSIVLVRGQNGGDWHVDAVRTDHTAVSDANKFVAKIENGVSRTNASENLVRIHLKEIEGGSKLHLEEEVANGSGTSTYGKGLGLRVAYQSEAGQDPVTAGNWMIANISNTSPTLEYKGTEGRSDTTRKVFPSGTSITKEKLAELVTIRDTEDNHTILEDKPYGTGSLQIMFGLTETPGKATPAGRYTVVLKAIDSQGKESNTLTVYVGVVSTDLKYKPKVAGVELGEAGAEKVIQVTGSNHHQGDEVRYTPAAEITGQDGKVYVPAASGEQIAHLKDKAQVIEVDYVEKAASTDLKYKPKVAGVELGEAGAEKVIQVTGSNHHQGDEVRYTPAAEITGQDGKVYVPAASGEQIAHLKDKAQVIEVDYVEKAASTDLKYKPKVAGVELGEAGAEKVIQVTGSNHHQGDEVRYTPAAEITGQDGKVYVPAASGEQIAHLKDKAQVIEVDYVEKAASTDLKYKPKVAGVELGEAGAEKVIQVTGSNHHQGDEVRYTPAAEITGQDGKVYVPAASGEQIAHLKDKAQVIEVDYVEKAASTDLKYKPKVAGVELGEAGAEKVIQVTGSNHHQGDEVRYTPAAEITGQDGKVYVPAASGEQIAHLKDKAQVIEVDYVEKAASTDLKYKPKVAGVELGEAGAEKVIQVTGSNHHQGDEVRYTPAAEITGQDGKVYVPAASGEQIAHLKDKAQVIEVDYVEKAASTDLKYKPKVAGVELGEAGAEKVIQVTGSNHHQGDEVRYTPAAEITGQDGKVYVPAASGEQIAHLKDKAQVIEVDYVEKAASTDLKYKPKVAGVELGEAGAEKVIQVTGSNHHQGDEVRYTPAAEITGQDGKVYVPAASGEQIAHLKDKAQVIEVDYVEKAASTDLKYKPKVAGVELGEAGAEKVIQVTGSNHHQGDEVRYTPAAEITGQDGKVYVPAASGEQIAHLKDKAQVIEVDYVEKAASTDLKYKPKVAGVELGEAGAEKVIQVTGSNHHQGDEVRYTPAAEITGQDGKVYVPAASGEQIAHLKDKAQVIEVDYVEKAASTDLKYKPKVAGVELGEAGAEKVIQVTGSNHHQGDEVRYTPAAEITGQDGKVYVPAASGEQIAHLKDKAQVIEVDYVEKAASTDLKYKPKVAGVELGEAGAEKVIQVTGSNHHQGDEVRYTPAAEITGQDGKVYVPAASGEQIAHLKDKAQVIEVDYVEKAASTDLKYKPKVAGVELGEAGAEKVIQVTGSNHHQGDEVRYTPAAEITGQDGKVYVPAASGEQIAHLKDKAQVIEVDYVEKAASTDLKYKPKVAGVELGEAGAEKVIQVTGSNHHQGDEVRYTPAAEITGQDGKVYVPAASGEQIAHLKDKAQVIEVDYVEKAASTDLKYKPKVAGVELGEAGAEKVIQVTGSNHHQGDEVRYTPAAEITGQDGKVYVPAASGEQIAHLKDKAQVIEVDYVEKAASTDLKYKPKVAGVELGEAGAEKVIQVTGSNHHQGDEVRYTPAAEITGQDGKVYVPAASGEQIAHLKDKAQVIEVDYVEKAASTDLKYKPKVAGVELGEAGAEKVIQVTGSNHHQGDEVRYTPAAEITGQDGKVYVPAASGEQIAHLKDKAQVIEVDYVEKAASTDLKYKPKVAGVELGEAGAEKVIQVTGSNHHQGDEVRYTPAAEITGQDGKVYVPAASGEQIAHLKDKAQVIEVDYVEKAASTDLKYKPKVAGVELGEAGAEKVIQVTGSNHHQGDEVRYTPAAEITGQDGKVYVPAASGEQIAHLKDKAQVIEVDYVEKAASTDLKYKPKVAGVELGEAGAEKVIQVTGSNHHQGDEVRYTPAAEITGQDGKVYVPAASGEQIAHLKDKAQVIEVDYVEKAASTDLKYKPKVAGVELGEAGAEKVIQVTGSNHHQGDEVRYTPAAEITGQDGKVYVPAASGEQIAHLKDKAQVIEVDYVEKAASTDLKYKPKVAGVELGEAGAEKVIQVTGSNHHQGDEVRYTPAAEITGQDGKVYVPAASGEQIAHLKDKAQVIEVDYVEKAASTDLKYKPKVAGVELGEAGAEKVIQVTGSNHHQGDEVRYTPAAEITGQDGKVYVPAASGEQIAHLKDKAQVIEVDYVEKAASTDLKYKPKVAGVELGEAGAEKVIQVTGSNHHQGDEVRYTPAAEITGQDGKVYVPAASGEQIAHLKDKAQVIEVDYVEKAASTDLKYKPKVAGVELGEAGAEKVIQVTGSNHHQGDEVRYTPAAEITGQDGKVYVPAASGEQIAHLKDKAQVIEVDYVEKAASTDLKYKPKVAGVELGEAGAEKVIQVTGSNHHQGDEVRYTPAAEITGQDGKVYVPAASGEQIAHLKDKAQVIEVDYVEKAASTDLKYKPKVAGVELGEAGAEKVIQVTGSNHHQGDEVRYTPAAEITGQDGKVYVPAASGEQIAHLKDKAQVIEVDYVEKAASTDLKYKPKVAGVELGEAGAEKVIQVTGSNHHQGDEVRYTPAAEITGQDGKVYVPAASGEQIAHLKDKAQVIEVDYVEKAASTDLKYKPKVAGVELGEAGAEKVIQVTGSNHHQGDEVRYTPAAEITGQDGKVYVPAASGEQIAHLKDKAQVIEVDYVEKAASTDLKYKPKVAGVELGEAGAEKVIQVTGSNHHQGDEVRYTPAAEITGQDGKVYVPAASGEQIAHLKDKAQVIEVDYVEKAASTDLKYKPKVAGVELGEAGAEKVIQVTGSNHHQGDEVRYTPAAEITGQDGKVYVPAASGEQIAHLKDKAQVIEVDYVEKAASTDLKYKPKVAGVELGEAGAEKVIQVTGSNHHQGDEVRYTPAAEITGQDGKVYVPAASGEQIAHLKDKAQVIEVDYVEKAASTDLKYKPKVAGVELGEAGAEKVIQVTGSNHHQGDEVRYTPAAEITGQDGKVYVPAASGEQIAHLKDKAQVIEVDYVEKAASTDLKYKPKVAGVELGEAGAEKVIQVTGSNHHQGDEVRYTPAAEITGQDGKVYVPAASGEQIAHLKDKAQVIEVDYVEKAASTDLKYKPKVAGVELGEAGAEKVIQVTGSNHHQGDEVRYTPAAEITGQDGKVYVPAASGEQIAHLKDKAQVIEVDYVEKAASTDLKYKPKVAGVELGEAGAEKVIQVTGSNHHQGDEVRYTPAAEITGQDGKVYVPAASGEQIAHLKDKAQVIEVDYVEKAASTDLKYKPKVAGVELGEAGAEKVIQVTGSNHHQGDEVRYTPAAEITGQDGKVYVPAASGEQIAHLKDKAQVIEVDYVEKAASTDLKYKPKVAGVELGEAGAEKVIQVTGSNHHQGDEVRYTPAAEITGQDGKVYVPAASGEQIAHLKDKAQVIEVDYVEKAASTDLKYKPKVAGVELGEAGAEKVIQVTGSNHHQGDEVRYTPAAEITGQDGKVYVPAASGEQIAHLKDKAQVIEVDYVEKAASTDLKYKPKVAGVELGEAGAEKVIQVTGSNHHQGDEVRYTPAAEITGQDGKVYVPAASGEQIAHLKDKAQVIEVEYVEKPTTSTPTFTVGTQNPQTGNVEVTVGGVPEGTKVTLPGVTGEKVVTGGKVVLSHNDLPDEPKTGKGSAQEDGKLPKEGTSEITIPGKLISAKGEPAKEFEVEIPLPLVVPDPEHLTSKEIEKLVEEVKKSNPNSDVKADDKGNITVTDKTTGDSVLIPVKDLTVKDFTPVTPTEKVPVKKAGELTQDEKDKVKEKVQVKNPGKEVTVGADGTATLKDPNTGITHTIPGTDLVNQDFTPVTPTDKVPVKKAGELTQAEQDKVKEKVQAKNPGKEVTVGADGTATLKDPNTGITHTIPGSDLVNQDFTPVKPTDKVPVKKAGELTQAEQDKVKEKVQAKNPGKEVTVGADGAATLKDPNTGITHTIPGSDLVSQDFTPVTPTEKVPVKKAGELTQAEKDKVKEKVQAKNPGKEVTVGADGTATVTDPTTGISHTIPGSDLVSQDFDPVKPTDKVPVKDKAHLTPEEKKQVADKVKAKNPDKGVTVGDDGTATVTDPTTGISHTIPGTDLVNQDFDPVKPTDKVPVKDKAHLTPEEKKQVADKVKAKNPGKEVTVGDDGTATVTDPTTGISHTIPGTELVNQDFEPVKPTGKVPVKDKSHLTTEEKKQVEDKVKAKNPGKEVTVGDDGTATVTDPTTGISHTIPGTELVNQDFEPVKPTGKVPVKDKSHLTPEEKKQVEDKVKAKNPGKEVTVGDDGTATVTDPTTGISHIIPATDLVNQDFDPVKPTEKVPVKDKSHLTPEEKKQVADKVKAKNPGKEVTVGDDGTATVTDPTTGISHTIPGTDLVNQDFTPVKPTGKVPVKDLNNLSKDEQDKVKESVEKANPGKTVVVEPTGKVTITDPKTNISHELSGEEVTTILPPVLELPEYTDPIGTTGVDENGNLILPPVAEHPTLLITKWVDENGNDLKPADAKAPNVLGEANEAFEHGEIEGYVFVRTETKDDVVIHVFRKVSPATPSDDTNRRPDTVISDEVPATQSQAVLPNTGTQEDRATGALGALSLLGAFGLLFAKKKKDDEEEA